MAGQSYSTSSVKHLKSIEDRPALADLYDLTPRQARFRNNAVSEVVQSTRTGILYVRKYIVPTSMGLRPHGDTTIPLYLPKHHPHILRTFFIVPDLTFHPGSFDILTEFCSNETLATVEEHGWLTPRVVVRVLRDITRALAYLQHGLYLTAQGRCEEDEHFTPLIHANIRPENILLRYAKAGSTFEPDASSAAAALPEAVLAGFELAGKKNEFGRDRVGEAPWIAPELITLLDKHQTLAPRIPNHPVVRGSFDRAAERRLVTTAIDLYSFGLVMFWLATGEHFVRGGNSLWLEVSLEPFPSRSYSELQYIIRWCLRAPPNDRPGTKVDARKLLDMVDAQESRVVPHSNDRIIREPLGPFLRAMAALGVRDK